MLAEVFRLNFDFEDLDTIVENNKPKYNIPRVLTHFSNS